MHRRPVLRPGRDAGRGARRGVGRPALSPGHRLQPGRQHDPRGRPVRLGRAALRPHGRVAGRAGRLRRRGASSGASASSAGWPPIAPATSTCSTPRTIACRSSSRPPGAGWPRGGAGTGAGRFRLGDNTGAGGIAVTQPTAAAADGLRRRPVQPPHPGLPARPRRHRRSGHPVLPAGSPRATWSPCHPDRAVGRPRRLLAGTCADPFYNQRLNYPQGVAVEPAPATCSWPTTTTTASSSSCPTAPTCARSAPTASAPGQFRFPYDVGIDARAPRQLYVADNNNHRVQAFDFTTLAFQRTWGQFGTEVGDFGFTRALAAVADDPAGGVAVADTANNRVETFAPDGARPRRGASPAAGPATSRARRASRSTRRDRARGRHARPPHRAPRRRRRLPGADGLHLGQLRLRLAGGGQRAVQHPRRHRGRPRPRAASGSPTPPTRASRRSASTARGSPTPPASARRARSRSRRTARLRRRHRQRSRAAPRSGQRCVDDARPRPRFARRVAATSAASTSPTRAPTGSCASPGPSTALPAPPGGLTARPAWPPWPAPSTSPTPAPTASCASTRARARGTCSAPRGPAPGSSSPRTAWRSTPAATTLVVADTGNDRLQRITPERDAAAALARLTVATAGTGAGTVSSAPAGIWCPTDCRQGYSPGAVVRLEARRGEWLDLRRLVGRVRGQRVVRRAHGRRSGRDCGLRRYVPTTPPAPEPRAGPGPTSQPAPSGAASAGARDRAAPSLRGVSLRPRRLRAAPRGATLAAVASGAALRYAVSERVVLSIAIERADKRGRYKALPGTLRRATTAGAHRLTFRARLRGRPLRAAHYRLVLRADRPGRQPLRRPPRDLHRHHPAIALRAPGR